MSMILILKRVSQADISRLMRAPEGLQSFLAAGDVEPVRPRAYSAARAEMIKLMAAEGHPVPPAPALSGSYGFDAYGFNDAFNAQKFWNALHFLLTGTADGGDLPAATLLLGGEPIPGDLGYGPAMAISPEQTQAFHLHLAALSRQAFLDRLDLERMTELQIYPGIWDEDRAELQEEVGGYFDGLRAYCRKCAEAGLGMIRALS